MQKKWRYILLISLLLSSCGSSDLSSSSTSEDSTSTSSGDTSSSETSSSSSGSDSSSSSSSTTPSYTDEQFEKYKTSLLANSKNNHFYLHYYRFAQKVDDYNKYDVWAWNKKPKGGEGVRFDWVGRTTNAGGLSASGDASIDDFGYVSVDIDLSASYKGGWDATNKKMRDLAVDFKGSSDDSLLDELGIQIVESSTRTSASGFWNNDGGDQSISVADFKIEHEEKTFYHVFLVQDNMSEHLSLGDIEQGATHDDPFADDDGTNVTYNKSEYVTADFSKNKDLAKTSEEFLNNAGVGYQIMVSSFADSDGDGFGDIYGVYQKLDYIKGLGVNVIWLTPIQLSDSYHGYDIADYLTVDPKFGSTKSDAAQDNNGVVSSETAFKDYMQLLQGAHDLGMKVIMDLVINHTSTTNKWFISSAKLDKTYRAYYQWGNHETDSTNINQNKSWYPYSSHAYSYYAKFGTSMPELNYSYQDTRDAVKGIALQWLEWGVDGFRMDAVKHIFMKDEVASDSKDTIIKDVTGKADYSSNLTKNLNFWRELNYEIKKEYPNAFIVGENFDGHAYHVSPYYEGFDSLFDFYSYFNLTSLAAKANNSSLGYNMTASSLIGASDSGTPYSASSDSAAEGTKTTSLKYGGYWNLRNVLSVNNQYRGGGAVTKTSTTGYSMINGAFTSNHDIARTINRVAGSKYNSDGLTDQGKITTDNYKVYDELATTVQIAELMLPGLTWIYYGDELGMTGNFKNDTDTSTSSYSDLAYRQPMKWTNDGQVNDGSFTTGYNVTGSGVKVEFDAVNKTSTVPSVAEALNGSSSHYNAIKAFASAKSSSQALIKGNFVPYNFDGNDYILNFHRIFGSEDYQVLINMSSKTQAINSSGQVVASFNGATTTSLPARSAVLINLSSSSGGGETPTSTTKTYTVNNVTGISDDYEVFAWAWASTGGQWYSASYDEAKKTLSFEAPSNISGCLFVKCYKGTTSPSWTTTGNNVGRIYYKTSDITASNSMTFPGWVSYYPS